MFETLGRLCLEFPVLHPDWQDSDRSLKLKGDYVEILFALSRCPDIREDLATLALQRGLGSMLPWSPLNADVIYNDVMVMASRVHRIITKLLEPAPPHAILQMASKHVAAMLIHAGRSSAQDKQRGLDGIVDQLQIRWLRRSDGIADQW